MCLRLDCRLGRVGQEDGLSRAAGGLDPRDGPVVLAEELEPVVANREPDGRRRTLDGQLESHPPVAETGALDLRAARAARNVAGSHGNPAAKLEGDALHAGRVSIRRGSQQAGGYGRSPKWRSSDCRVSSGASSAT